MKKDSVANIDSRGIPVSYTDEAAIHALENAHREFLTFSGDPLLSINALIDAHPRFLLAHLFKAAYLTQFMEQRVADDIARSVAAAKDLTDHANARELAHLRAVDAWSSGDYFGAVRAWETILTEFPLDLLALQLAHLSHVLLGGTQQQLQVVEDVLPHWDSAVAGIEFVLGFYAFGLEENGRYSMAEEVGRKSLMKLADNPYAVHAVGHVMEMQGRQYDGLQFMYAQAPGWTDSGFAIHLWWHTALFHLDLQEFDRVLDIYDTNLRSSRNEIDHYEELDASALLWRLQLLNIDVADRWTELADKWAPSARDTVYAFNTVHAMMALASDRRDDAVSQLLDANEEFADGMSHANTLAVREAGLPLCRALGAFVREKYAECVNHLAPVRERAELLGGSFVQRDIIDWTLLEAAIRDWQFELALRLARDRQAARPDSVQAHLDLARVYRGVGKLEAAEDALAAVDAILAQAPESRHPAGSVRNPG